MDVHHWKCWKSDWMIRWKMSLPTAVGVDQMIFEDLCQPKQNYYFYDFLLQHRKPKIFWFWQSELPLTMCLIQISFFFKQKSTNMSIFFPQEWGNSRCLQWVLETVTFLFKSRQYEKRNCYVQRLTFPTRGKIEWQSTEEGKHCERGKASMCPVLPSGFMFDRNKTRHL